MNHQQRMVLWLAEDPDGDRLLEESFEEPATAHIDLLYGGHIEEAASQLSHRNFDAILLDVTSKSDGIALCHRISRMKPDTPIVILSHLDDPSLAMDAIQAGAQGYLSRDELDSALLARTIEHAIERQALTSQVQASEAGFKTIINENADAIIIVDRAGVIRFANPAAETLFMRPADDLVGQPFGVPVEAGTPVELCIRRPNADSPVHTEMHVTEIRWHGDNVFLATLRDITTRKAAERKLQYHADILRNVHDAIIVTDGDGVITYWNEGATAIFGYTEQEAVNETWALLHPNLQDKAEVPMLKGEEGNGVFKATHKDGGTVWVETNRSAITDVHDQPIGFVNVFKDVTKRSQTEEALRQSEAFNRGVLRSVTAHIAVLDSTGTIIAVNRAWRAFSEANAARPSRTNEGANYLGVCRQAAEQGNTAARETLAGIEQVLAGEIQQFSTEYACHSPDEKRWYMMHAVPLAGERNGAVISHENITDQVQANRRLKESEQRYKSLFDYNPDAVYSFDLDGNFLSANAAIEEKLGYSTTELRGMSFEPFVVSDQLTKTVEHFKKAAEGEPQNYTTAGRHKDGRRIEFDVTNLPIVIDDEIVGVFGIAKDVTEQVQTERRLREVTDSLHERIKELNCLFTISELVGRQELPFDELLQQIVEQIPFGWQRPEHTCARITLGGKTFTSQSFQESEFQQTNDIIVDGQAIGRIDVFCFGMRFPPDETPFLVEEYSLLDDISNRITEAMKQRRASEVIRESEARYRLLAENATDLISRHAPDGTYLYASPACRQLLGYTPAELVGTNAYTYLHPEDRHVVKQSYTQGDASDIHTVTYRIQHKNGTYVWFETTSSQICDAETGDIQEIIATSRDVSERYQRERKLEAIVTVARALREASTYRDMPPIILEQLLHLLPVTGAALALQDKQSRQAVIECVRDAAPFSAGQVVADDSIIADVIETGTPHLSAIEESGEREHAVACAPLLTDSRSLGAIWCSRESVITQQDLRLISAIADIGASAINRSMLHEQTQRRMQRLTALRNIDMAVATSIDVNVTLNVLLDQARSELEAAAVAVLLMDETSQRLTYRAGRGFRTDVVTQVDIGLYHDGAGRAARDRKIVKITGRQALIDAFEIPQLIEDEGFLSYFAAPLIAKGQVRGVLEIFRKDAFDPDHEWMTFLETLASQAAIAIDNATMFEDLQRSNAELRQAYDATIEGWSRALELRDEETKGHTQRVTDLTVALARAMDVEREQLVHMRRGALLHDIGKIGIPDSILLKDGPLNDKEWEIMKQHPTYAYEKLAPIDFLRPALDIPYCHHEKWDGSGYPRGLEGEQIPLAARIFAVVDVYDALTSDRPYRDAWSQEKAIAYIREQAGQHFDPSVVKHFLTVIERSPVAV